MREVTYKSAGVDIDRAERFIHNIIPLVNRTRRPGVIGKIGGFSGFFKAPKYFKDLVLVAATDGVGTKLLVAGMVGRHDTVGIDLVAMCVNDVVTCGAEPLFFLDYFSTQRIDTRTACQVIKGIVDGCRQAHCSLLGGETAEMPGLYKRGDYDMAGFCVGAVERKDIIDGSRIMPGDIVLGLASSGLHSNGFSLVRKLFSEKEIKKKWADELLQPTRIYVQHILSLKKRIDIKGIAHITGGGFYGNIPRILPKALGVEIRLRSWDIPAIFKEIQLRANLTEKEMFRTFNMGIGMVVIINRDILDKARRFLSRINLRSWDIGKVVRTRVADGISFL